MTMAVVWKIAARHWDAEKNHAVLKSATNHPLQGVVVKDRGMVQTAYTKDNKMKSSLSQQMISDPLSGVLDGPDPLSDLMEATDPLSAAASRPIILRKKLEEKEEEEDAKINVQGILNWDQKKAFLLANFTTTSTLTFTSSFLTPSETSVVKTQTSVPDRSRTQGMSGSERIRARLEQLDCLDDASGGLMREVGGLTQREFVLRLNGLKMELTQSWNTDQRVKALKIAIQCVKLLGLSAPEHFYPMKFALVTDILDTLGSLVLQRLKAKTVYPMLPGNAEAAKLEAQETARNWFYKIASIRELLPRFYLEAALLPCYSLLFAQEGEEAVERLTQMIRGIGDPLIASYTRMFLCRMGVDIAPHLTRYITENIKDFLLTLKQDLWTEGEADVNMGEDKDALAVRVLSPPFEWMMQCLVARAPHHVLQVLLSQCEGEGLGQHLLVSGALATFPHSFLAVNAVSFTQLIAGCDYPGKSQHELVSYLGVSVNDVAPPPQQHMPLLNAVWKLIARIPLTVDYLSTAGIWLEFTAKHFTATEVNTLLGDVLKRVRSAHNQEQVPYPALLKLISTALTNSPDPESLFPMPNFQGVLSVFQRDSVSVGAGDGVTWGVTEALLNNHPGDFRDPTLVQHLLMLCGALHDSINALTTDDERRQLSLLITTFIRQVNFGRDFEQQLNFYVNARAAFTNLDAVLRTLVQCVCRLAMETWNVMRGQHSGKTAAFVRACSAYCFITIPSLALPSTRLKLYLSSGTVALMNNCLGQGDACMKAAIREVLEVASSQNQEIGSQLPEDLLSLVANLSSTLVATPDPPDAVPPLYLLRGLTNAVKSYQWQKDTDLQAFLSLSLLNAISASAQDSLPYHIQSVEGNDALYGGDPMVQEEAEQLCTTLIENLLSHIQGLRGVHEKRIGPLALATLCSIVTWGDLSQEQMMNLATFIWSLILKHSKPQNANQTREWLSRRAARLRDTSLEQFAAHVSLR